MQGICWFIIASLFVHNFWLLPHAEFSIAVAICCFVVLKAFCQKLSIFVGMGVDGRCPKIFVDVSQNKCLAFCTLLHLLPPSQPARTAAVHLLGLPKYRLGQSTLQIAVAWSSKFLFVSSEVKKSQETQSAIMIRSLLRVLAVAVALGNAEGGEVCDEALTEVVACQGR